MAGMTRRFRYVRLPLSACRLLRVEARLQAGFTATGHWPLLLDGLLTSVARRDVLGERYGVDDDRHIPSIPVGAFKDGCGAQWFWLASCGRPVDQPDGDDGLDIHWWHRRFDHDAANFTAELPPLIREQARYKSWRMPQPITVCSRVEWRVAGDPAAVDAMLARVVSIGGKKAQGEGAVLSWTVEDCGPVTPTDGQSARMVAADWVVWAWGGVSRPVPARASAAIRADTTDTVEGVVRPPYWRPAPNTDDGRFTRTWRPLVAPWAHRLPDEDPVG